MTTSLSEPPLSESAINFETDDALPLRKKPGRKPNPHVEEQKMRRKEQNREAQRHHRERKERYVLELERRIDELAAQVRSLGGEPIPERPELADSRPPPKKCIMRGSGRTKNEEDSEDDDEPAQNTCAKSKSGRGRAGSLSKSSPETSSVGDYYVSAGAFQPAQAWLEDQKLGLASRASNGTITSQADALLLESMLASPQYQLQYQVPDRTQMGYTTATLQTIPTTSTSPVNQQPAPLSSMFPGLSPMPHPSHPVVQGTTSSPPKTTPNGLAGSALTIPVSETPATFNGLTATPSPFPVFMHFSEHILASNGISTAPILSDDPVFMEAMMRELLGENFDGGACAVPPQAQMQTQTKVEPVAAFCGRPVLGPDGKSTRFSRCLDSLPSPEVKEHLIALKKLGIVDVDELCEDLRAKARCRGNPLDWRNWRVPKGFYDKWVVLKGINGIPEDDF